MSESQFNQVLNIELDQIIEVVEIVTKKKVSQRNFLLLLVLNCISLSSGLQAP